VGGRQTAIVVALYDSMIPATYNIGLHPKKNNRTPSTRTGSDTHAQRDTHAQQRACDNCGQRNRGCSCCLMDRVARD